MHNFSISKYHKIDDITPKGAGIAEWYRDCPWVGRSGFDSPSRAKHFSLVHSVLIVSEAQPTFYLMGTGCSLPGGKALHPHTIRSDIMAELYFHSPFAFMAFMA
jgi:hypothetical protein